MSKQFKRLIKRTLMFLGCLAVLQICFAIVVISFQKPIQEIDGRDFEKMEAEAIASALMLYTRDHGQTLPPSLEALRPDYLGSKIQIERFILKYPGRKVAGEKDLIIAAERVADTNWQLLLITDDGQTQLRRLD